MKLTRQHFEFIAATLRACKPLDANRERREGALDTWREVVDEFAKRLRDTNESFRPRQFYAACDY